MPSNLPQPSPRRQLLVVVGPTACGKTQLGIELARTYGTEVICADSRTVYKGMNIGTAKPEGSHSRGALVVEGIRHWGMDLVTPDQPFTMVDFQQVAKTKLEELWQRGKLPIMVGGTGLYIRAVIDGLMAPGVQTNLAVRAQLEQKSTPELALQLKMTDPQSYQYIDVHNRRRLIRALEVSVESEASFWEQRKAEPLEADILQIGIEVDRKLLYERINKRVDDMIARGLEHEVQELANTYGWDCKALDGIGYRQMKSHLSSQMPLPEALELIKRDTRRYAKRQLTWFGKDERIQWMPAENIAGVVANWAE